LHDIAILFAIRLCDRYQHSLETRTPVLILRREVGSAIKWLAVGCEKSCERPAALSGERTDGKLVAGVDVRTLVAVDFYCDEMFVDDLRHLRIVVRLAIHYMTPVAPHGADIEQDGFVLTLCNGKGLLTPLVPLDGLMHR